MSSHLSPIHFSKRLFQLSVVAAILVLGGALAACGDDEPQTSTVTETSTTTTTVTAEADPADDDAQEGAGADEDADGGTDEVADCPDFSPDRAQVSVRNIGCDEAARLFEGDGLRLERQGWECNPIERYEGGAIVRCVEGERAIRYTFVD